MRTKSRRGGRPKPSSASTATSTPSSVASPPVPNRDTPNAGENPLNETSRKETDDVLDDVDCFQKDTCIRCDESGGLLVCSESGCPIALHEYCMSCKPTFDEDGRFYCPYCSYKRTLVRVNELRRRAMLAKRALSDFIDFRVVSGGNSPQIEEVAKKKASDVSTCGVDGNPFNHGSHLGNERDQNVQVEQNQNVEGGREKTVGDDQPTVVVNGENHDNPLVSNISNNISCRLQEVTPEIWPVGDSTIGEEFCQADTSGTHQLEGLQNRKIVEEENLRSMDHIQNERIVKDQGQPEISSVNHADEEAAVEDVDHGTEQEQENIKFSRVTRGKGNGGEQIQRDKERMLERINACSGNKDLNNKAFGKERRVKSRAGRRIDLQNTDFQRKPPPIQDPEPVKRRVTKMEKVSSKNLQQQKESAKQLKNLNILSGKRKRLNWSTEEEEMLKEGVQKFSSTANKNLPWRKILEFGRHIFDGTRAPADLKDKWRKIVARDS